MFSLSRGEVPGFKHDKALEAARECSLFCLIGALVLVPVMRIFGRLTPVLETSP